MKNHVTKLFTGWHEHRLTGRDNARVSLHLEECTGCRRYYEKMSSVFDDRSLLASRELKPDPFLPARVKTLLAEGRGARRRSKIPVLRWSLAGIGAAVALLIGIYTGKGLDNAQQPVATAANLSEYYGIIFQQGSIDTWDQPSGSLEGVRQ